VSGAEAPGVALVTGAGRRLGRAIALDLAMAGHDVAVHYHRSRDAAEELAREINALGRAAEAIGADLAKAEETEGLMDAAAALGPVRLLVNNAAIFEPDTAATVSAASLDAHYQVNLRAPVLLAHAVAQGLPEGQDGNVVNIIDQRVWRLSPNYLSYTASKYALWGVTRTLAQALAPRIRVNAVGPGPTLANERQSADDFAEEIAATPLGRGPAVAEILAAIRFLLATPSMTGQMLALDGGQHLAWDTPAALAEARTTG
jgi:NAD(P)-dependent dehydrogenase (short-subunit alcohol dehydrogenase family)